MGGQNTPVTVQERHACPRNLPVLGAPRHLAVGFCKMGHCPGHTAMPIRQESAMQIQGQCTVPIEIPVSCHRACLTAFGEADFFEEQSERHGETIVDGCVLNLSEVPMRIGQRLGTAPIGTEVGQIRRSRHML
jgi:hypothetical protein